ncbi:MAG: protein of unknown function DUF3333 [Podoviridae sp. ctg2L5]|nr:MAG: protein of unknown function DUF3333 [Podoviridae sp. ctg2L5]
MSNINPELTKRLADQKTQKLKKNKRIIALWVILAILLALVILAISIYSTVNGPLKI